MSDKVSIKVSMSDNRKKVVVMIEETLCAIKQLDSEESEKKLLFFGVRCREKSCRQLGKKSCKNLKMVC